MHKLFRFIPVVTLAVSLAAQAPVSTKVASTKAAAPATKTTSPAARPAGEFVIHLAGGPDKLLTSYRGKVVVIAFMYTTCPHCQHTAGVLAKIQTEYAEKGVQVLGVTFDGGAQQGVANFIKITGANFPCGYSTAEQVTKFLHVDGDYYVPMLAFLDRAGNIRRQVVSDGNPNGEGDKFLMDQEKTIRAEIDKELKIGAAAGAKKATKS